MFTTKLLSRTVTIVTVFILALGSVHPAHAAPPANDNFADAEVIASLPFSAAVDITEASIELNEPQICYTMQNTVWYAFTPVETMVIRANVDGSAINTNLSIYHASGSEISDLTFWGCTSTGYTPSVFTAEAGQTYYLQAGSIYGETGTVQINLEQIPPPANDYFANAEAITSLPFTSTVDNGAATRELDEPEQCAGIYNTVWYSFTPSETMMVQADTNGSTLSPNINIYRSVGYGITQLEPMPMTCTIYYNGIFMAEAGQTYYLQAGGQDPITGNLQVNLKQVIPPANDNFANAESITSLPINVTVDIAGAGIESGEPSGCNSMERTVWYSFTPTESISILVDTEGSSIITNVHVYQMNGSGISDLSLLGCVFWGGSFSFTAMAGQTYYLQAGGEAGTIQFNVEQTFPPANDNLADATIIGALPFDDTVDTLAASLETGEPTPSCAYYGSAYRSVWYAFTPTTSGVVSASIPSAAFAPVFAVYTGNSLAGLTEVGCQNYSGNLLTLQLNANTTYYFQVGNLYPWDQGGSLQFHLDVPPPPVAGIYFYPDNPSVFDTIQFYDNSYDPGQGEFQSFTWDFGDGATSTDASPTYKYAADGDYTVQHSVTTTDGRTASTSQVVQVRTHDVTLTKVEAPESAKVGKSETIRVSVNNPTGYSEMVWVELYKSVPGGYFDLVDTIALVVPAFQKNDKVTKYTFNYTFTSDDAAVGKVIFRAVAIIENATDAFPQDNERLSSLTMVKQK